MPYRFGYAVKDQEGNDFNQQEQSDGEQVATFIILYDCSFTILCDRSFTVLCDRPLPCFASVYIYRALQPSIYSIL